MDPLIPYVPAVAEPAHVYTIEFHRALYTEELYDLYSKYELAVHKKERSRDDMKDHICNSPVYDPNNPNERKRINSSAPLKVTELDDGIEFKDEGINPGLGTFHMYHRIDGKLVAVGNCDIMNTIFNS